MFIITTKTPTQQILSMNPKCKIEIPIHAVNEKKYMELQIEHQNMWNKLFPVITELLYNFHNGVVKPSQLKTHIEELLTLNKWDG